MAIYGQSLTIQYVAWDTVNNAPKTGDASNHTLRWVKDGTAAAPTNSPSEVDATNAPGVYKLTLTASETQCWVGTLCGKSSTSGVVLMPITLTFERLPAAAPGDTNGLPIIGSDPLTKLDVNVSTRLATLAYTAPDNDGITAIKAQTDKLAFAGTGPYDVKATLDGEKVTVLANEDKTGYSLATADVSAIADAVWDEATSGHQTAGTYGKTSEWTTTASGVWGHTTRTLTAFGFNVTVDMSQTLPSSPDDNTVGKALKQAVTQLDATMSSRLAAASYTPPDNTSISAIKTKTDKLQFTETNLVQASVDTSEIAAGVWGYNERTLTDARLNNLDTAVSTRLAATSYIAPDNTSIAAIKAKTDKLTFNDENYVYAIEVSGVQVIVQPLGVRTMAPQGDGGTITAWAHSRIIASWLVDQDVSTHNLVFLAYSPSQPATAVCQSGTGDITLTLQQDGSTVISLNMSDTKTPSIGTYAFVIRDQTTDTVLVSGKLVVHAAPDVS